MNQNFIEEKAPQTLYVKSVVLHAPQKVFIVESATGNEVEGFAKQVIYSDGDSRYFVKWDLSMGLVDHLGTFYRKGIENKTPYRKVAEATFTHYVDFLKTGNKLHLRYAERSMSI